MDLTPARREILDIHLGFLQHTGANYASKSAVFPQQTQVEHLGFICNASNDKPGRAISPMRWNWVHDARNTQRILKESLGT